MNLALLATTLLMSVAALAFVVTPLVRVQRARVTGSVNLSLLGVLVVFGLGIALYGVIGRPNVASHDGESVAPQSSSEKVGSVESLLTGLETRLEENPDDAKGWLLLAQSYELLGRIDEARTAYGKATALGISNDELAAKLDGAEAPAQSVALIRGHVSADPGVADSISDDAVVYITARTADNPMPLAVLRRSAAELPFDFELSDTNSMVKGAGLSTADALTISVGVSSSGDALAMDEGLQAVVSGVDPHAGLALDFTIGQEQAQ